MQIFRSRPIIIFDLRSAIIKIDQPLILIFGLQCSRAGHHTNNTGFGLMRNHAVSSTTRTKLPTCKVSTIPLGMFILRKCACIHCRAYLFSQNYKHWVVIANFSRLQNHRLEVC